MPIPQSTDLRVPRAGRNWVRQLTRDGSRPCACPGRWQIPACMRGQVAESMAKFYSAIGVQQALFLNLSRTEKKMTRWVFGKSFVVGLDRKLAVDIFGVFCRWGSDMCSRSIYNYLSSWRKSNVFFYFNPSSLFSSSGARRQWRHCALSCQKYYYN